MVLSDFLLRQNHNNINPHAIIPISFNMHPILHENHYNIGNTEVFHTNMMPDKIQWK